MPSSRFNFEDETVSSVMKRKSAVAIREPRRVRGSGEASESRSQCTEKRETLGDASTFEKLTAGFPVSTLAWFAGTGKRKKRKAKSTDSGKEKAEKKPPPPKKTTYVDRSVPGGRLVRSSRKLKNQAGKAKLKDGGGFLGW